MKTILEQENLKSLSDTRLIERTLNLVQHERELLASVLHHLREIETRRLFSSLGYKSLFDFTVRRLGYSEDQACRRISAMRLLKEIPLIEEKITRGEITLTHLGMAQSLFQKEKKNENAFSSEQKIAALEKFANKPVREAERIALALSSSPVMIKRDQIKASSETQVKITFNAPQEVVEKIEHLKGFIAHKYPGISLGELFGKLCDLGLQEWNPAKIKRPAAPRVNRSISQAQIRRDVFKKANHRCEKCGSTYALEIDHIQPKALGGTDTNENLRLLCRHCNQRAAIEVLGIDKMENYLN